MPVARLAVSTALLFLLALCPRLSSQFTLDATLVVWVDAGNGSDTPGRWALGVPYNTLNYALDQVWDVLHPTSGPLPGNLVEIRIAETSAPIAPVVSGGHEADGWLPGPGMRPGAPFPLRMMNRVSIVGASRTERAVITLDGNYVMPAGDQAAVLGASWSRLENVELDGSQFISSGAFAYRGVMVRAATDFELINCDVHDWHDQLWIDVGLGNEARIAAIGCTFSGSWPVLPLPSEAHSLVHVEAPGTVDLLIDNCVFRDAHDGLEVAATVEAPHFIRVRNSLFELCENSIEGGGNGAAVLVIEDCDFLDGGPRPGGHGGIGGIGARGGADFNFSVRRCTFTDVATAGHWDMDKTTAVLDMGRDGDPGLNGFCFTAEKCNPGNVLRTVVQQYSEPGNIILAAGNFWLPSNQGASGSIGVPGPGYTNRFFTQGTAVGPMNYTLCPPQCLPGSPPPQGGCEAPVTDRNYSIKASAAINFGTQLPPADGYLPPPCLVCDCTR